MKKMTTRRRVCFRSRLSIFIDFAEFDDDEESSGEGEVVNGHAKPSGKASAVTAKKGTLEPAKKGVKGSKNVPVADDEDEDDDDDDEDDEDDDEDMSDDGQFFLLAF
jgi:hypothetical protein